MTEKSKLSRRELLAGAAAASVVTAAIPKIATAKPNFDGFLAVSSGNGMRTVAKAMELMNQGVDTLDAAIAGVNIVELDPNDMSVGYGGLPNEDGVVQLDSCCMHGPTYNAGGVAAIEGIKTPSNIAKLVMERTDHCLIVGRGAAEFAKLHGYNKEEMLTERARQRWVQWKERLSATDDYIDPSESEFIEERETGTITCLCLNDKSDISGVTTTSGLSFKIPGRVGDSPLIGNGVYVDNAVGACGSTGRGEANILMNGSRIVVENMRQGMSPQDACLDVLQRICDQTVEKRLLREPGKPDFQLQFYALNKNGEHAGGCIHGKSAYSVHDGVNHFRGNCRGIFE